MIANLTRGIPTIWTSLEGNNLSILRKTAA